MRDVTQGSLWRHGDFMKLWTGQTVSQMGSVVTRTALAIVAVITLHSSAIEMGILAVSGSIGVLLVGLFAGAVVDRSRRRPLMVTADLLRAAVLGSVPAAALIGSLQIEHLYVVAFLEALLGSFFDIAYRSYLPSLLPAARLLDGNAKIGITSSVAEIGGPGLAGGLVQLITAPMALLVDAISYAVSAISLALIKAPETIVARVGPGIGLRRELAEGLTAVAHQPLLRPMALASATDAFFGNFYYSLYTLYALTTLGLSPFELGIVVSAGGVGSLTAAFAVGPLTRRLGIGPTIVWTRIGAAILSVLTPLAGGPPLLAALFLFIPQLFGDGLHSASIIDQLTVRQLVTPRRLLGRVNGALHVLVEGVGPIGALVGAAIAEAFGIRLALWLAVLGALAGLGFLVFSPLRSLRAAPTE